MTIDSLVIVLLGDQVARKGGMTGGFYDSRRSRLKFVKICKDNRSAIDKKTAHLENVGNKLRDILLWFNDTIVFLMIWGWCKAAMSCYFLLQLDTSSCVSFCKLDEEAPYSFVSTINYCIPFLHCTSRKHLYFIIVFQTIQIRKLKVLNPLDLWNCGFFYSSSTFYA